MIDVILHSDVRSNQTTTLINVGVITFDEEGNATAKVEKQEELDQVLSIYSDISVLNSKGGENDELNSKKNEDIITAQTNENDIGKSQDDLNDIGSELQGMTKEDLVNMAAESGFPEEEFKGLNKKELIEYLSGKLEG